MASIFTFDPDPPRVSSPWATPPIGDPARTPTSSEDGKPHTPNIAVTQTTETSRSNKSPPSANYTTITRLEAEPQEGPTEYKLHLLLRRRRSFTRASTARRVSGSLRRSDIPISTPASRSASELGLKNTPPPLASIQSRQHRLEQLTTQLLWRLQQSCSYHISSTTVPVLPHLPDDARLSTPDLPQRLLPGLEESKGALYEIGVADDGTIVGLAEDEMEESLNNLRAMAASLGCGVEVLRMVPVGECEWMDHSSGPQAKVQTSRLLVAEAHVRPLQHLVDHTRQSKEEIRNRPETGRNGRGDQEKVVEQLRVSVTGATNSGKSSLLGTLSTATLDNGRGKSRLSLLKHRHEIASGMTSSVTQELVGYRDMEASERQKLTQVVSYGSGDVSSWIDIHAAVEAAGDGRLVFLSDSAGHPRYHRTTVRGIVGWQPHWTLLCIPADATEETSGASSALQVMQEVPGPVVADLDLSKAHLQLCLNLDLPLVIVITKYDLATKAGLRQILSKLLSTLKEAGRKPCIIHDTATSTSEVDLHAVSADDLLEADNTAQALAASPLSAVPIILTSAVKGTSINKLHAFLRQLPILSLPDIPPASSPSQLFYIEDIYSIQNRVTSDRTCVIGGYLRYGSLHVGDELLLGPYPLDTSSDDSDSGSGAQSIRLSSVTQSRSFPGALHRTHARTASLRERHMEWRRVRIVSLRNLRIPVHTLHTDQVGTMGIVPVDTQIMSPSINRIRKGMVLANRHPKASKVVEVQFAGAQARGVQGLGVGSAVVLYVASVRVSCKVISVTPGSAQDAPDKDYNDDEEGFGFGFDGEDDVQSIEVTPSTITITLQFIASKEFVEVNAKALIMPGGGPGLLGGSERGAKGIAGLEGFVGKVIGQH